MLPVKARVANPRASRAVATVGEPDTMPLADVPRERSALDAGLLAAAEAGTPKFPAAARSWTSELGLDQAVTLLGATLAEEKSMDQALSKLAQSKINHHAQTAEAA